MAKDKLNNLLKFTEYDHLQPKQAPTKKTEIGGFAVLEEVSVKDLIKQAAAKCGKSKKELKNMSPKKLKKIIGVYKTKIGKPKEKVEPIEDEKDENEEVKESLLFEKKKASAKQIAARKRFMMMIKGKSKGKGSKGEEEDDD